MNDITLKLDKRTAEGKHVAELRSNGLIPSIVYGGQSKPLLMQSESVSTDKVVRSAGKHTPIHILMDGKSKLAIIKDIDRDPIKHKLRHVAFHTINQNDTIHTEVSIKLTGIGHSIAERDGLVILQALEEIEIKAKPADLPDTLELSIINLSTADDKLTVADIVLPKGVSFADIDQDMTLVIANVYEPGALQAANDAAGGDADAETNVETEHGEPAKTSIVPEIKK
jgi:large subunit ribosomal protein L25